MKQFHNNDYYMYTNKYIWVIDLTKSNPERADAIFTGSNFLLKVFALIIE